MVARLIGPMTATFDRDAMRVGFEPLEREIRIDRLPVSGELPRWLDGSLLRTGPARWEVGTRSLEHWFDGLAMLHRFAFHDGEVSYANRFLRSRAYRSATERGEIGYVEFATDPCCALFERVSTEYAERLTDNGNVNLCRLGQRFIALNETPIPVQFDEETLEAAGVPYRPPGLLSTAHPHIERATGAILNYTAVLGPSNSYRFFRLPQDTATPELLATLPVGEPAYVHSFGLTARWFVLIECPFVVRPLDIVMSGRPYIENYRWQPERGMRLHLLSRDGGEHRGPFVSPETRFLFHHVNAYEAGEEVVVDICAFPDAAIIDALYMERLRAGEPIGWAHLERYRISPGAGEVAHERLLDEWLDLPQINYARCNERPHRYVWGVGNGSGWIDRIVKADIVDRLATVWAQEGCFPGEPVFVAAPDARGEDEGVLLSVVLGPHGTSFLLVLDAGTLRELARADVPHHIPFGFHGMFAGRRATPGIARS
jgi:beta,beta-carotene 9',10'-dioxygenase